MSMHHAIDGLAPDQACADALRVMVRTRFKEMWKKRDKTVAGDTEALHDMRVASRRLRGALELASPVFPGKDYARFRQLTEQLTEYLGAVRDGDVLLQTLDDLRQSEGAVGAAAIASLAPLVSAEHVVNRQRLLAFLEELEAGAYAETAADLWHDS